MLDYSFLCGLNVDNVCFASASILLTENFEGKLADFGLAMPTESENPMASFYVERAAGTKAYMPPEAFKGKVSPRLDIFSFGVVSKCLQMRCFGE